MKCLAEKRVRDGVSRYRIKRQTLDRHKMMIVGIIEICPVWGRHNEGSKRRDSLTLYLAMQISTNSSAHSQSTLLPSVDGRKRYRSHSMESTTSASSRKRSASEDPTASSPVTRSTRLGDTTPPSLSDPTSNDIDAYMVCQGESDILQSTLLPSPHPSLPEPIPDDALSSTFLRFQTFETMRIMPLIEGSTWALVSKSWWRRLEKAATGQIDKQGGVNEDGLGPVDNSSLFDTSGDLNENLVEGVDFECVPEVVWHWLTVLCVPANNHFKLLVLLTPPVQIWQARTRSN